MDAVENFKRAFQFDEPGKENTGIAFLIVCDMLLTGFDAPIEQVMYIDKSIKNHNLLQTIARVNRVAKNKKREYIVDYIGLANHLKSALSIYGAEHQEDLEKSLQSITVEIPVLEDRYRRLIQLFEDNGVKRIEDFVQQRIPDAKTQFEVREQAVACMEDVKQRSNFEVYLNKFMQSMDIVLPHPSANAFKVPVKRFGFLWIRIRERYKDESLSISNAGEKVKKLIDEHLISLGINPKIPPVELFSPQFIQEVDKNRPPQAKASEMEHAIRKHCKVRFEEDPALFTRLSEKLEALLLKHKENWNKLVEALLDLRAEVEAGRQDEIDGLSAEAAPFYDLIGQIAFAEKRVPEIHSHSVIGLVSGIIDHLKSTIDIIDFWNRPTEVARLRGELSDMMILCGIEEIGECSEQLVSEVTQLAKNREKSLLKG